ncbi:MAG: hypothetical protein IJC67_07040, partial [Clostridia bacterium]|nr:hypothetical protein [Clostridia bacterium]
MIQAEKTSVDQVNRGFYLIFQFFPAVRAVSHTFTKMDPASAMRTPEKTDTEHCLRQDQAK